MMVDEMSHGDEVLIPWGLDEVRGRVHEVYGTPPRRQVVVELTPERTTSEWRFVETVKQRTPRLGGLHRMTATHGARKFGS